MKSANLYWQRAVLYALGFFILSILANAIFWNTDFSMARMIGKAVSALLFGLLMAWWIPRMSK